MKIQILWNITLCWLVDRDVSEERIAFIFMIKQSGMSVVRLLDPDDDGTTLLRNAR